LIKADSDGTSYQNTHTLVLQLQMQCVKQSNNTCVSFEVVCVDQSLNNAFYCKNPYPANTFYIIYSMQWIADNFIQAFLQPQGSYFLSFKKFHDFPWLFPWPVRTLNQPHMLTLIKCVLIGSSRLKITAGQRTMPCQIWCMYTCC